MNTLTLDVTNPELPPVTAVMVVGKMPQWQVQLAVNCFENQTYKNRELIIINNCITQYQASGLDLVLPRDADGRKTIAHVFDTEQIMSAGMCRNYGISMASSNILIQWDAHCWHSPYRIEEQLQFLTKHEAQVCMLTRTLEYSYGSGYASYWTNRKHVIPNSMMMLRPKDDDYADLNKGEELTLLTKLIASGYKPIAMDRPHLMCRMHYSDQGRIQKPIALPLAPPSPEHMQLLRDVVQVQALG